MTTPNAPARLAPRTRATGMSAKDLITVGVYTAIYIAVYYVAGFIGVIPFAMALLPLLLPIVTGIPFMLYLTKIRSFGMLTISGLLVGLLMFLTGHAWMVPVVSTAAGLAADLALRAGKYRSWPASLAALWLFSLWVIGPFLPFFTMRESYRAELTSQMGADYADAVLGFIPMWYLLLIPVLAAIGALIGGHLGRAVLRKHFVRAGIA